MEKKITLHMKTVLVQDEEKQVFSKEYKGLYTKTASGVQINFHGEMDGQMLNFVFLIYSDQVVVIRQGENFYSKMNFIENQKTDVLYQSEYGLIPMETYTKLIDVGFDQIKVIYLLYSGSEQPIEGEIFLEFKEDKEWNN